MAILNRTELEQKFKQSRNTVLMFLRMPGSPGYKNGASARAPWMCDEEKYDAWVKKQAEKYKG